ncbi:hypothetical protein GUITHDRAFT_52423, partial [Guillardia theta CCMP2712]
RIGEKIQELFDTGRIAKLETMKSNPNLKILQELKNVWGVGDTLARRLIAAGIRSVEELKGKTTVGEGARQVHLPTHVRIGVEHNEDINTKMPRREVAALEQAIRQHAQRVGGATVEVIACGSYRRGKQESGDIDCLLTRKDGGCGVEVVEKLMEELQSEFDVKTLSLPSRSANHDGCCNWMGILRRKGTEGRWRRFDVKSYPIDQVPFALLHMTGSDHFNRSMRLLAKKKGLSLSDHGIYRVTRGGEEEENFSLPFKCTREKDVFDILREYLPP